MKTLRRSSCAVLPLVLRREWYDMIDRGEKLEEYRDATQYWNTRIRNWWTASDGFPGSPVRVVEFRHGYARDARRMAFEVNLLWGYDNDAPFKLYVRPPEWGETDTPHSIIVLGERVNLEGAP